MNLFGTCVYVLLLSVSLGGDGASASCSAEDFKKCSDPLSKLSLTDVDVACSVGLKSTECLIKTMETCPTAFGLQADLIKIGLKFQKAVCDFYADPIPSYKNCSGAEILKCSAGMNDLSEADRRNPSALCPVYVASSSCLLRQTIACPTNVKNAYKALYDASEQIRKECGVDGGGESASCSAEDFKKCSDPLSKLSLTDVDVACSVGLKSAECLIKTMETCPATYRPQADLIKIGLNFQKAVCDFHADPIPSYKNCSGVKMLKCSAGINDLSEADRLNPRMLCPLYLASSSCLLRETKSCPANVKNTYKALYDASEQTRKQCGVA